MNRALLALLLFVAVLPLSTAPGEEGGEPRFAFVAAPLAGEVELTFLFRSGMVCEPPESRGICRAASLALARLAADRNADVLSLDARLSISPDAVAFTFLCPSHDAPELVSAFADALRALRRDGPPDDLPDSPPCRLVFPCRPLAAAFPGNALFDRPSPRPASFSPDAVRRWAEEYLSPRCLTVLCRAAGRPAALEKLVRKRLSPRGRNAAARTPYPPQFLRGGSDEPFLTPGGWPVLALGSEPDTARLMRAFLLLASLRRGGGPWRLSLASVGGAAFAFFAPPGAPLRTPPSLPVHDGSLASDLLFARAWRDLAAFLRSPPSDPALAPAFLRLSPPSRSDFPRFLAAFESTAARLARRPAGQGAVALPLGSAAALWCLPPSLPRERSCFVLASGWRDGRPLASTALARLLAAGPARADDSDLDFLKGTAGLTVEPVSTESLPLSPFPPFAAARLSSALPLPGLLARFAAASLLDPRALKDTHASASPSAALLALRCLWPDYSPPQAALALSSVHLFVPGRELPAAGAALPALDFAPPPVPPIALEETARSLPDRPASCLVWRRAPGVEGFEFPLAALIFRLRERLPAGCGAGCFSFPWGSLVWGTAPGVRAARSLARLLESAASKEPDDAETLALSGRLCARLLSDWCRPYPFFAWGVMLHPRSAGPFIDREPGRPGRFAFSAAAARFFKGRFALTGATFEGGER